VSIASDWAFDSWGVIDWHFNQHLVAPSPKVTSRLVFKPPDPKINNYPVGVVLGKLFDRSWAQTERLNSQPLSMKLRVSVYLDRVC
jgi:hypothetical protein